MSLVKETKKALLEELFPDLVTAEEEKLVAAAAETVSQEGEASAEEVAEEPVTRGVVDCSYEKTGVHLDVLTDSDQVVKTAQILKDAGFFLEAITGVDWIKEEQMEVIYDYNHVGRELCRVMVRVKIPRKEPIIPTVSEIHSGANWHERETHDFFGIKFQGHPYLVPLLLPEDADFHPLLKDFTP